MGGHCIGAQELAHVHCVDGAAEGIGHLSDYEHGHGFQEKFPGGLRYDADAGQGLKRVVKAHRDGVSAGGKGNGLLHIVPFQSAQMGKQGPVLAEVYLDSGGEIRDKVESLGVDISKKMLAQAHQLNQLDNITYLNMKTQVY